ncbi:hypothetical protein CCACVL1_01703 [Corchorus capsularis]|uniref:Endonuclease/exonuclease/phosphatase n=1 Tax=Corchorus capsularis TaxID=210143 RepID=A0A1R3KGB4_COCAP|nr:hypothetical protein CCACVL1_01703 [Corchorus capsularis]
MANVNSPLTSFLFSSPPPVSLFPVFLPKSLKTAFSHFISLLILLISPLFFSFLILVSLVCLHHPSLVPATRPSFAFHLSDTQEEIEIRNPSSDWRHKSKHKIEIMLDSAQINFPDLEFLNYEQFCLQQSRARVHSIKYLILNARGAYNPDFIFKFAELTFEHQPDIVIVTETRLSGEEDRIARESMTYTGVVSLQAVGYFGGIWFLWK